MEKKNTVPFFAGWILIFFFLSGAVGLIYQIVWTRIIALVMGNTVFSISTVLTAFMGGLALGSYLAGRFIDKRNDPLRVYGILEGLIGLYCLTFPWLIQGIEPLYRIIYQNYYPSFYTFSLLRFLISGGLLLIPTTLMGATLPVLSKYFVREYDKLGWTIGKLYSINTLGAVLGSFGTGFFLIPFLGVRLTIYIAAFVNLLIAFLVIRLDRKAQIQIKMVGASSDKKKVRFRERRERKEERIYWSSTTLKMVLLGFALSGFAAMVYEVAWTRVLSLTIGSSVYAFSLMLTAFISGLALGSIIFSKFIDRRRDLILGLAVVEVIIGLSSLFVVPILGRLPVFIIKIILQFSDSFALLQLTEFGIIFLLMMVPTIMMGATFPMVSRVYIRNIKVVGRSVGNVYASNTVGAILGSFSAGFLLIPWIGIQKSIMVAVLINVIVGSIFFLLSQSFSKKRRLAAVVITLLAGLILSYRTPGWNRMILSSGPYLYAGRYQQTSAEGNLGLEEVLEGKDTKMLYYKEGVSTTISVRKDDDGQIRLQVNGKADASSRGDMPTQVLLGYLPLLLHPKPEDVLVIGLASGVTLGSVEQFPVKRIDCVEISPAMVKASEYFNDVNHNALKDPRVNLIIEDGRNHLTLTNRKYDVIISEPSNPWMAGIASLFTREFFDLCKARLREGGITLIWLQGYGILPEDFRMVVNTFNTVFPYAVLWEPIIGSDYLLMGSDRRLDIDYQVLGQRLRKEKVRADLERIKIKDVSNLLGRFVMGGEEMREYAKDAPLHTDDNTRLEFSAPKSLYKRTVSMQLKDIEKYRGTAVPFLTNLGEDEEIIGEEIRKIYQGRQYTIKGVIYRTQGTPAEAMKEFEKALSINPHDGDGIDHLVALRMDRAANLRRKGKLSEAINEFKKVIELEPGLAIVHGNLGVAYRAKGMVDEAIKELKKAVDLEPGLAIVHNNLGVAYQAKGMVDEAINEFRKAIELDDHFVMAINNLARLYAKEGGNLDEGLKLAQRAVQLQPTAATFNTLARLYYKKKMYAQAEEEIKKAIKLSEGNPIFLKNLEAIKEARGD